MRRTFFMSKIRMKNKKIDSFFDHFPPKVAEYCFQLWHDYSFDFIVSKSRDSKLGDYRFSPAKGHQVTVTCGVFDVGVEVFMGHVEAITKFRAMTKTSTQISRD